MLKIFARLICILVVFFSSFVLAEGLESSIPNENGDYCVIVAHPSVLPKGGIEYLGMSMWSSTEVFSADINGQTVSINSAHDYINDSVYGTESRIGKNVQETTLYTLTVVPESGSEYSCSTLVNVLDSFFIKPTENSCVLTAIPLIHRSEDEVFIYFSLSWDKFENNAYIAYNSVLIDDKGKYQEKYTTNTYLNRCISNDSCSYNRTFFSYINIADVPITFTTKVYWFKKNEAGNPEPYNTVSRCSVTVEGMLPDKLPITSQPVQPTKLTYNDGLEAGKQLCIDNPESCGIAISSAINVPYTPIVYDAITNILSIPEILIPVTTEESQSYEAYEAQLKIIPTQNNDIQLQVSNIAKINKPVTSSWSDNVNAEDSIGLLKMYLTQNNRNQAISVIDSLVDVKQNIDKATELLNGINQYSGDSTKQILYVLEFFLRKSSYVLAGDLISEGTIVRAAELI
ncbi:MAG: hypothetical protein QM487_02345, partial [Candidatus Marithrix sp.]